MCKHKSWLLSLFTQSQVNCIRYGHNLEAKGEQRFSTKSKETEVLALCQNVYIVLKKYEPEVGMLNQLV